MLGLFGWISIGLATATALFVAVLTARRIRLAQVERRRAASEHRLRPFALALLDGDPPPPLNAVDAETFASLVARYSLHVRGAARNAIALYFERTGAVAASVAALRDRRIWRRAEAAHALGDMASSEAVPRLLDALSDPARDVRAAAARSLGRLGAADAAEPLVRAIVHEDIPYGVAGHALLELGDAALPALRTLASHADAGLREVAVELLGLLGAPADAPLLVERLRDSSAEVRARAARALGRLAAAEAADAVRTALGDRIPFVRAAAARATAEIGDRASVPTLIALAAADGYDPAQAAARAVAHLDPNALREAARDQAGPHLAEFADRVAARL